MAVSYLTLKTSVLLTSLMLTRRQICLWAESKGPEIQRHDGLRCLQNIVTLMTADKKLLAYITIKEP